MLTIMGLQYVVDVHGKRIAVIIPIEEWNKMKEKYPDFDVLEKSKITIPPSKTSEKPLTPKRLYKHQK
jgi:hypothetical protein